MARRHNKLGLSRDIPADIKRRVRQRDKFGCVVCGSAFVTYEHFRPQFAEAASHEVDGICLLCPKHHYGKGVFVSREAIDRAREKVDESARSYAAERIDVGTGFPRIKVATVTGDGCSVLLHVDGEDVISILPPEEVGAPHRVSACLRDAAGKVVLEIVENELRSPASNWDFEFKGSAFIIRSAPRQVSLKGQLEAGSGIRFDEFRLRHRRVVLRAADDGWLRGLTPVFAFGVCDIAMVRKGGTVLHVAANQIVVGKAPEGGAWGSMHGGTVETYGRETPEYDRVAAFVRNG